MSTQNAEKVDSVQPEDEKKILNQFTEFAIIYYDLICDRYKNSWANVTFKGKYLFDFPEFKKIEAVLKLCIRQQEEISELKEKLNSFVKTGKIVAENKSVDIYIQKPCNCLDHILPDCEYHNASRKV